MYEEALSEMLATMFHSCVGELLWIRAIRLDLGYATKELARCMTSPTVCDYQKLRFLVKHTNGTIDLVFAIRPLIHLVGPTCTVDLEVHVDSDGADCQ